MAAAAVLDFKISKF